MGQIIHGVDIHDEKVEIIHGIPFAMAGASNEHNVVYTNIFRKLSHFLQRNICTLYGSDMLVKLDDDIKFYPDISVVCDRSKITRMHIQGAPDLVVEILSLSTAKHDRSVKFIEYAKAGVRELWIVDPKARVVEVYSQENGALVMSSYCTYAFEDELAMAPESVRASVSDGVVRSEIFPDLDLSLDDVFADI